MNLTIFKSSKGKSESVLVVPGDKAGFSVARCQPDSTALFIDDQIMYVDTDSFCQSIQVESYDELLTLCGNTISVFLKKD